VVNIKKKKSILNTLDELDKKAENSPLAPNEIDLKQYLNNRLAELLREEEIKWYQRDKRNYWRVIPTPDRIIEGDAALKQHITTYYKDLSGPSENMISLDESREDDIPQVSELENEFLVQPSLPRAVIQMDHNKASGSDGFPAEFYQACWDIIKKDLMALFMDFLKCNLPLYSLNFGTLILMPKCREAITIQQYIPNYLLNVSLFFLLK
jgi:DNA primase